MQNLKKFARTRQNGPEAEIQKALIKLFESKGWFVKETHGNIYQFGFPDLFCAHRRYGTRWVEVKNPAGYSFTPAQIDTFPKFTAAGVGIWILTAATEAEYNKIFGPSNWHMFLGVMKATSKSF